MTTLPTAAMNGVDELFGPAPVLSTEDAGSFKLLFEKVAEALMPRDFIEMIYIRRFVCEVWLIERLGRHGTIAIERRYQESREQMLYNARVQKARKDKLDVVTFVNTTRETSRHSLLSRRHPTKFSPAVRPKLTTIAPWRRTLSCPRRWTA